jgi:hypothetical protein
MSERIDGRTDGSDKDLDLADDDSGLGIDDFHDRASEFYEGLLASLVLETT